MCVCAEAGGGGELIIMSCSVLAITQIIASWGRGWTGIHREIMI